MLDQHPQGIPSNFKSEIIISARRGTQVGAATISQVYAPNINNTEEEMDVSYEDLQRTINEALSRDIMIVIRDCNSKVGKDWEPWNGILGKFGYGEMNQRGEKTPELLRHQQPLHIKHQIQTIKVKPPVDLGVLRWFNKKQNRLHSISAKM